MSATDRLQSEQAFHDEQALRRKEHFARHPEELQFDEDWFLDHETWVRPALALLGDVRGRRVLDYGCGHGMASVVFAKRGAQVTAFDLSPIYLEEAGARADANGVRDRISFVQAVAGQLPFATASFDGIWGSAILHHLDLTQAGPELARVLKPGGLAVFCEPWGGNPLVRWGRHRLPYPGKHRTADEQPLRPCDLETLRPHFTEMRIHPFQLLSMARRLWPALPFRFRLEQCDVALFRHWPLLRPFCRYIVLSLRK